MIELMPTAGTAFYKDHHICPPTLAACMPCCLQWCVESLVGPEKITSVSVRLLCLALQPASSLHLDMQDIKEVRLGFWGAVLAATGPAKVELKRFTPQHMAQLAAEADGFSFVTELKLKVGLVHYIQFVPCNIPSLPLAAEVQRHHH